MASVLAPDQQRELARQLRAIVGSDAVVDQPDELLVYECDAYTLEKNPPNAVVLPRTTEQISQVVKLCASLNVPIIPRCAGEHRRLQEAGTRRDHHQCRRLRLDVEGVWPPAG